MEKRVLITLIVMAIMPFIVFSKPGNSQIELPKNERYIIIDNYDSFFGQIENGVVFVKFELINIMEDESSKPVFVSINELNNVVKFSIKSSSEEIPNQRRCFLRINEQNYLITFRLVLDRMNVKHIVYENQLLPVGDFFALKMN